MTADRAMAESPFGGTIAHGYLTLSLLPFLLGQTGLAAEVFFRYYA